jgi:hypothetical protein
MIAFDPYRAHLYCRYLACPTSPGGELFDRVVQKTYYSEDEARNAIATILKAVNFMHARFGYTPSVNRHTSCAS